MDCSQGNLVKVERTQFIGHYGLTFAVTRFTVTPDSRSGLRSLCFLEVPKAVPEVCSRIADLYEKMLAGDLTCVMTVAISKPMTRRQADLLNVQKDLVRSLIADALSSSFGSLGGYVLSKAVDQFVANRLHGYHVADVIIGFDARVSGGIGPQHSTSSMLVKFYGG